MPTAAEKQAERKRNTVKVNAQGYIECRVCKCTDIEPCDPPCSWAEVDLCSTCQEAAAALADWHEAALKPNRNALMLEYLRIIAPQPSRRRRRKTA